MLLLSPQPPPGRNGAKAGFHTTYGYTFDDRDYEAIADLAATLHFPPRTYWEGPTGPSPSASSTFQDLSFDFLRRDMKTLRKDTFRSFLQRNDPIPAHRLSSWHSPQGKAVIIFKGEGQPWKHGSYLSRAGFSADGSQALAYDGGGEFYLLEREGGGAWHVAGQAESWIE